MIARILGSKRLHRLRRGLIALPLLAAACATPQATPPIAVAITPDDREKTLAVGEAAYDAGRYTEALGAYRRLLEADPADEDARLGVADCTLASGALKPALAMYATLIDAGRAEVRLGAAQGQGLALLMQGNVEEGRARLLEVVQTQPSLWRAWNGLGWSYDRRREWSDAAEAYRRATELSPVPHLVLNNWGMSLLEQGNPAAATGKFRRAVELRPDFEVARNNLQLALGLQGKYQEALAGTDDQRLPTALNNVGYAALLRGDTDRAGQYFQKSVERSPRFNPAAWRNLQFMEDSAAVE